MYYLLTESLKEQHQQLVEIILKACAVEKIYLLGSTLLTRRTESIFMLDAASCRRVGHYYLLVIVNSKQGHNQAQDTIENNCQHFIPVTAVVLSKERFEEWLIEGHPFAHAVYSKAILLHGEKETFQQSITTKDETAIQKESNAIYTAGINKVEEFLAGADLYRIREQNKMCAFMLHQAAEQALHTMLQLETGLRVVTHNLDKLYRYCCMACYKLPEVILGNNKENDKRLFNLLQKAYIDTRYRNDYYITTVDLLALTDILKRLSEILKETNGTS